MSYVAGENLLPLLVALLIGFIAGIWIWKFAKAPDEPRAPVLTEDAEMRRPYVDGRAPAEPALVQPPVSPPSGRFAEPASRIGGPRAEPEVLARRAAASPRGDDVGDNDVASGAAAAVEDVADQFLGIHAHPAPDGDAGPAGTAAAAGDDLQTMKGVGPKLASLLVAEGITRFEQIAALTPADLTRLDAHLGAFKGRLVRDRIVEQAAFLAAGDRQGYEKAFGKL